MNMDKRLKELGQRNRAAHDAAYRARVKRTNQALGIRPHATPEEIHEAILRQANGN